MTWKSKIAIVSLLSCTLVNCSAMQTVATGENGRIEIHADARGMAELSNLLAANAQIAKDAPNLKGASWQLRELQKQQETMQYQIQFGGQE